MIKEHLQNIAGVELYAIAGFLIFFIFFILISIYTVNLKKAQVERYSSIPLDDELNKHLKQPLKSESYE